MKSFHVIIIFFYSLQEHQKLLWGLKFTVEGLLAAHTTNVWSTYGGLARLCCQLDKVMCHCLRHPKGVSFVAQEDYWDFVLGLRRLQPVLAPSVDRIHRQAGEQGVDRGAMWLRTSLEAHTLSSQLRLLVDDREHLSKYYHGELLLLGQVQQFQLWHSQIFVGSSRFKKNIILWDRNGCSKFKEKQDSIELLDAVDGVIGDFEHPRGKWHPWQVDGVQNPWTPSQSLFDLNHHSY